LSRQLDTTFFSAVFLLEATPRISFRQWNFEGISIQRHGISVEAALNGPENLTSSHCRITAQISHCAMSALRYSNKAVVTMIAKLQAIPRSLPNLSHPQPSHRFLISSRNRHHHELNRLLVSGKIHCVAMENDAPPRLKEWRHSAEP
jgi:hypothetical protein